ncbi:unnamed protein product [Thlaspi arvense]|uniref:Uncharacterized protein n=1 Tax=Thlaspi arvense TaxID=13288 RepID=A0AAU9SQJ5_THLAR|nr:unnamed protein product [Thlaspi arvense]
MILAMLFANSVGNVLIERILGIFRFYRFSIWILTLYCRSDYEAFDLDSSVEVSLYSVLGDVSIFLVGKDEYDEVACKFVVGTVENTDKDRIDPVLIVVVAIVGLLLPRLGNGESVMKYGAIGDGIADDTSAFQKAWDNACKGRSKKGSIHVPAGKVFLLNSLHLTGPCLLRRPLLFTIDGEIIAESDPKKWQEGENGVIPWFMFDQVDGLVISGRGWLDGQGKRWWDIHCRDHPGPNCIWLAPTMMTFSNCGNVTLKSLRFRNSAQTHVLVMGSQNVYIRDIKITSPVASPNTDGVHITSSSAVSITHSHIATGDDCVSIGDQVNSVNVSYVKCGPGHGVSIGSLGRGGTEVAVENIRVSHVHFTGTTNGARIKTWPGATGYVRGIEFSDIRFSSVENPIIIDQFYGCSPNCTHTKKGVHIEKVRYMNMRGTSATEVAMKLECSGKSVPCSKVFMGNIDLSPDSGIDSLSSLCTFVQGSSRGIVRPSSCL